MSQEQQWNEASEQMGKMIRWDQQAKPGEEDKTTYLGPVLQGIYTRRRDSVGQNASTVYEVQLANGELVSFWGSALLDGKFNQIPQNSEVRVTFLGIEQPKTPGGRAYRNFKVEFAKPITTMIEPGANPVAATPVQPIAPASIAPAGTTPAAAPALDSGY